MSQDKEKNIQEILRKFVIITPIAILVLLGILEANKSLQDDSSKVLEETKKEITLTNQKLINESTKSDQNNLKSSKIIIEDEKQIKKESKSSSDDRHKYKSYENRFFKSDSEIIDTITGDIISKELDSYGNLIDCSRGNSSESRGLPTCNEIISKRIDSRKIAKKEKQELEINNSKQLNEKVYGNNFFVLPNGSKIKVKTAIKYNDETKFLRSGGEVIINAEIENVDSTKESFENIFIKPGSKLVISFLDAEGFELLKELIIPLQVKQGQENNIVYRKKLGASSNDVLAIKLQARKPINSLREYLLIKKLGVSAKFK